MLETLAHEFTFLKVYVTLRVSVSKIIRNSIKYLFLEKVCLFQTVIFKSPSII